MRNNRFWPCIGLAVLLALIPLGLAAAYTADFDSATPGTPVENLAIPGLTFSADPAGAWAVVNIIEDPLYLGGNAIAADSDGTAPLTINFAEPQQEVTFSWGVGETTTATVRGYLGGALVFTETVTGTQVPTAPLLFEGRETFTAVVDRIVFFSPASSASAIDNIETVSTLEEEEAPTIYQRWDPGDARINPDPAMEVAIYCATDGIELWGFADLHYGYVSLADFLAAPATDDAPFWTSADGTVRVYHLANDWWGVQKDQLRGDTSETYEYAWDGCPRTASITAVYDAAGNLLVYETGP